MSTAASFRNCPQLAGICTMDQAMKPGLSVEECVRRLKRYHYAFKRLHQIFIARLTSEPIYELKMGFSLHAHLCAEHVSAMRKRVGEMREPPLGLEAVPDPSLELAYDEILAAPATEELLLGIYEKALPALRDELQQHLQDTNPLADYPSTRVCRFALLEIGDLLEFGTRSIAALVNTETRQRAADWLGLLDGAFAQSRAGVSPAHPGSAGILPASFKQGAGSTLMASSPQPSALQEERENGRPLGARPVLISDEPLHRHYSGKPFQYDKVPKRDDRFPDPYNMGVNAEVFLYDDQFPPQPKTLMMFYKRLREVDVPEMMASIIMETTGKPWPYYRDMTRQLWDEARHAMMGEVGFANLGINWPEKVMINFTWSLALNTQLKPIERHAVLYFIEQGLMPKNGKRFEWEVGLASKNPLSALFQDYDWADEVLHARIGRDWYLKDFKDAREAVKYGDECWSRVLMSWDEWRRQGLTQHRNWWPQVYRDACQRWGIEPDPKVLAYSTSYQTVRADLKELTGSA